VPRRFETIPGLGPKRRALLLRKFGSLERIRRQPLDAIASVPGSGRVWRSGSCAESILRTGRTRERRARSRGREHRDGPGPVWILATQAGLRGLGLGEREAPSAREARALGNPLT